MKKLNRDFRIAVSIAALICTCCGATYAADVQDAKEITLVGVVEAKYDDDIEIVSVELGVEEKGKTVTYRVVVDQTSRKMASWLQGDIVKVVGTVSEREDGKWFTTKKFFERVNVQGKVMVTRADDGTIEAVSLDVLANDWWDAQRFSVVLDDIGKALASALSGKQANVFGYVHPNNAQEQLEVIKFEAIRPKKRPSVDNETDAQEDEDAEEME